MLPSRVGTIDRNRPGTKGITFWERAVGVNRPYRRWVLLFWFLSVALSFLISAPQVPGQSKGHKKRARATATPTASPGEQSLTNIPLPIGHEAKGLVLPDFDGEGHLRGKFEAGTAHRIDREGEAGQGDAVDRQRQGRLLDAHDEALGLLLDGTVEELGEPDCPLA